MKKEMEINISEIIANLAKIDKEIVKIELKKRLEKASFLIHRMDEDTMENLTYYLEKAHSLSKEDPDFGSYFRTFTHNVLYNLFCLDKKEATKVSEKIMEVL